MEKDTTFDWYNTLAEHNNLGLNKKIQDKHKGKSVDSVAEDLACLSIEEFEAQVVKYMNEHPIKVRIQRGMNVPEEDVTFIPKFRYIFKDEQAFNGVISNYVKTDRIAFDYPKELRWEIHGDDGINIYIDKENNWFDLERSPSQGFRFFKDKNILSLSKFIEVYSKQYKVENVSESQTNLGFNKKIQKKFDKVDVVDNISQISFEDPEVEHICHEHDVYTYEDAAKVISIMIDEIDSWFSENSSIKTFNEFKYFTGLKTIKGYAFTWCTSLKCITIPSSVTEIGCNAFYNCKELQSINIPDNVCSIGFHALNSCNSLKTIYISNNHHLIDGLKIEYPDIRSSKIKLIDLNDVNESELGLNKRIQGRYSSNNVETIAEEIAKPLGTPEDAKNTILKELIDLIPEGWYIWKEIDEFLQVISPAFDRNIDYAPIGIITFDYLDLPSVNINYEGEILDFNLVNDNDNNKEVLDNCIDTFKEVIEDFKSRGKNDNFDDFLKSERKYITRINKLTRIRLKNKINSLEESNLGLNNKVKKKFDKTDVIDNIGQIPFEDLEVERICHEHGVYTYDDAAKVNDENFYRHYWFKNNSPIKTFNEFKYFTGLKTIKEYAFSQCRDLQSIILPNSIDCIEDWAFTECNSLKNIIIPDSVTGIECNAFEYCTNLQSINIPDKVKYIGSYAFYKCQNLKLIHISKVHPLREQLQEEYPGVDLVDPSEINESTNLGLNSKIKNKFGKTDAIDNINSFIDLGLPSGTLWCNHNYGSVEESHFGEYLTYNEALKINTEHGILPSANDFRELMENCSIEYTEVNGVKGNILTSNLNKNSIFFPDTIPYDRSNKDRGLYWTSSKNSAFWSFYAYFCKGGLKAVLTIDPDNRFTVRLVMKKANESSKLGLNNKVKNKFEKVDAVENVISDYVDLGLPSGTLWKAYNEGQEELTDGYLGHEYTYNEALKYYKKEDLPTWDQFSELLNYCDWFIDNVNGKRTIRFKSSKNENVLYFKLPQTGVDHYWSSSTPPDSSNTLAYALQVSPFYSIETRINSYSRTNVFRIRTVINRKNVSESDLGLNKKIQKKFDDADAIDMVSNIQFEDPEVERICHEHGVYTYEDAANVTSIFDGEGKRRMNSAWFYNSDIKSFKEFRYFTGIDELKAFSFIRCRKLKVLHIPKHISIIKQYSLSDCYGLEEVVIYSRNLRLIEYNSISVSQGPDIYMSKKCPAYEKFYNMTKGPRRHHFYEYAKFNIFDLSQYKDSVSLSENYKDLGLNKKVKKKYQGIDLDSTAETMFQDYSTLENAKKSLEIYAKTRGYDLIDSHEIISGIKDIDKKIFIGPDKNSFIIGVYFRNKNSKIECIKFRITLYSTPMKRLSGGFDPDLDLPHIKGLQMNEELLDKIGLKHLLSLSKDPVSFECIKTIFDYADKHRKNDINENINLGLNKKVQKKFNDINAIDNISEYVDLGLPSGNLWCKHNYGVDKEYEYGEFYAFDDALKTDEAPSKEDFEELHEYCDSKWVSVNGVYGMKFVSKVNKQSVFFPAAGMSISTSTWNVGATGSYWSTSITGLSNRVYCLYFGKTSVFPSYLLYSNNKLSLRTVKKKMEESSLGLNSKVKKKFDKVDAVDNIGIIKFEDPEVERICHEYNVYTIDDAAKVTSILTDKKDWFGNYFSWFYKSPMSSFNEFKYFTGLKELEKNAFYECTSLQSISIPDSISDIRDNVFVWDRSLQSIVMPNSVISIGSAVFNGCHSLKSVNIPDSVISIDKFAFNDCKALQSINIPDSVTNLGHEVFCDCESLKTVYISKNHPLRQLVQKQCQSANLVDPNEVNESNLGLNSKVKKKFDNVDAVVNISEYVDLELPSGNLWAKCNVGSDDIQDYGDYMSYDEAIERGLGASMPTEEDWEELKVNCDFCYTEYYTGEGYGLLIISKKDKSKEIFLPAGGHQYETSKKTWSPGANGDYLINGMKGHVKFFDLHNKGLYTTIYDNKNVRCLVRLVSRRNI